MTRSRCNFSTFGIFKGWVVGGEGWWQGMSLCCSEWGIVTMGGGGWVGYVAGDGMVQGVGYILIFDILLKQDLSLFEKIKFQYIIGLS